MNVCIQADAVAVGRALIAALLFVGERAASFSEAKFDDTAFGSVLERWRTHWTSRNWPEQFVETSSTRCRLPNAGTSCLQRLFSTARQDHSTISSIEPCTALAKSFSFVRIH